MQRFGKVLFVLVILLLAANVIFWTVATIRSNNKAKQEIAKTPQKTTSSQFQIPTPTSNPSQFLTNDQLDKILDAFKRQQSGLVTAGVFTFEYQGTIEEVYADGGVERFNNFDHAVDYNYALKIVLKGDNNVTQRYLYDKNDMAKAVVTQITNGQESPITASNLKVGDRIKIRVGRDMLKNYEQQNVVELKITKI